MSKVEVVTSRYSDALFRAAQMAQAQDAVYQDCCLLSGVFAGNERLRQATAVGGKAAEKKLLAALTELVSSNALHKVTANFAVVLAKKGRAKYFLSILEHFIARVKAASGELDVMVTSAFALQDDQKYRLISVLQQRSGAKIVLRESIDKQLIGGLVVRIGAFELDGSVRCKLQHLQQSLESIKQ